MDDEVVALYVRVTLPTDVAEDLRADDPGRRLVATRAIRESLSFDIGSVESVQPAAAPTIMAREELPNIGNAGAHPAVLIESEERCGRSVVQTVTMAAQRATRSTYELNAARRSIDVYAWLDVLQLERLLAGQES